MKITLLSLIIGGLLSASAAWACTEDGSGGILPDNDIRVPMAGAPTNGMDEQTFNALIDKVANVYEPLIEAQGNSLIIERNWASDTFNASARRVFGGGWMVSMYGGLARHPVVTYDAFMLVMCHELGHHMGGAPKVGGMLSPNKWASNEGQSDYWGSNKCLKRVLSTDDNQAWAKLNAPKIDATAKAACDAANRDDQERALCLRVAMAGKSLGDAFAAMGRGNPQFSTPDAKAVGKTNHRHPEAQCRLDTYFQGALCTKSMLDDVSDKDPKRGFCVKSDGFEVGVRPLCWYKPGRGE